MHGRHRKLKDRLNKTPARVYDDGIFAPWPFAKTAPSGVHEALKILQLHKKECVFLRAEKAGSSMRESKGVIQQQ